MSDEAKHLHHLVVEAAKALFKDPQNTGNFESCLYAVAPEIVQPPFRYWIGERNRVWALDVWDSREKQQWQR